MADWIECPKCGVLYKGEHACLSKGAKPWQPSEPFPFLSWDGVPEEKRVFIDDLVLFDSLIHVLFAQLEIKLDVPPLELEIHRIEPAWFYIDAFAGVKGKIILSINNEATAFDVPKEVVAYTLIHEILHKKYPRYSEEKIEALVKEKWKEIYPKSEPPKFIPKIIVG